MKRALSTEEKRQNPSPQRIRTLVIPLLCIAVIICALTGSNIIARKNAIEQALTLLYSSAEKQADTLNTLFRGQLDTLNAAGVDFINHPIISDEDIFLHLKALLPKTDFLHVCFVKPDGSFYMDDGTTDNVVRRAYFSRATEGDWAIQRVENPLNGNGPLFVLSTPLVGRSKLIGVLCGIYSPQMLEELIAPKLFDDQAYSILCSADGALIAGTSNPNDTLSENNIFVSLETTELEKGFTVEQLRAATAAQKDGSFTYRADGNRRYVVYLPLKIETAEGAQWYLFNVATESVVSSQIRQLTALDMGLTVVILAASSATYTLFYHQNQRKNRQLEQERNQLRVAEEQTCIAINASGLDMARYDIRSGIYYNKSEILFRLGFGYEIANVPEAFIEAGLVAQECVEDVRSFYQGLRQGKTGKITVYLKKDTDTYRWFRLEGTIVADSKGLPNQAILIFRDVTDQREKETVFAKWRQFMAQKPPESYTLFRCNLSKGTSFDSQEGALLHIGFSPDIDTFNDRTKEYASRFVHLEDYDDYTKLLNSENLLAGYYRGSRRQIMEYRERVQGDSYRWLRLTVETAPYENSHDIEVFLLYEDINRAKQAALTAKELQNEDTLTGVLNRNAFIQQFSEMLFQEDHGTVRHALILVDVDDIKGLNDTYGHAVGDQALVDIAQALRAVVRKEDILGRLGGDEFLICLRNIANQAVAEKKILQLQASIRQAFSHNTQLSACIGLALYPEDGQDFNTLFHNADQALVTAKENGKGTYAFSNPDGQGLPKSTAVSAAGKRHAGKRVLLVIDDDLADIKLLHELFEEEYTIVTCSEEKAAMTQLHRYGITLAIVVLSLDLAGLNALSLLDQMQRVGNLRQLPVLAISAGGQQQRGIEAIAHGARDFILKPLDGKLLRIRMASTVSRGENERLRAQNAILQTKNSDGDAYRAMVENTGALVVEYDWSSGQFSYDPALSEALYGNYDQRNLWQILLSDLVADTMDVMALQNMVHALAQERNRTTATMDILLKTPFMSKHWFTVTAFKRLNDRNLTGKIILTFMDVNETVLSGNKLRFQAEHDSLTGLYNRSAFLKLVEETVRLRPANFYYLLYCDINDFRFINERFGREEGDKLLHYTAEKLQLYADAVNGFTGRLSNDDFAMLLPNNPSMLEKITSLAQNFYKDYPLPANITCRAGAYLICDVSLSADAMLDLAATASSSIQGKYAAWLAVYDESMSEKRRQEKAITAHMEEALAKGQFDVYIQPQFHHATGHIVGGEALVRWEDPLRGIIFPGEFIPVFEENGFITKLDEYVWERTAQYIRCWIDQGHDPVPISVNVSREDIKDPNLCAKLQAIVAKYELPSELLRLEITESLFAKDVAGLTAIVEQLHAGGFLVEMDDFGSGYSSLNILKDVPVDIIKLDMKFFSGQDNLGRGGMIINTVLRMARWLNIPVIAEGVELQTQADFLLSVGCSTIQGFLYEKPLPAELFSRRFLKNIREKGLRFSTDKTQMEASAFWNPASLDSQIFNNYIGPAAVFECCGSHYEILRMNRRFLDAVQIDHDSLPPASGLIHFHPDYLPLFRQAVETAIRQGLNGEEKADLRCLLPDCSQPLFHVTLRVMAKSADRALLFATLNE